MKKFTFKINRPKGPYRTFNTSHMEIKYEKAVVGVVHEPCRIPGGDPSWRIRFMVTKTEPDDDTNCDWKWITLRYSPSSFDDAKAWLNHHCEVIVSTFPLRKQIK